MFFYEIKKGRVRIVMQPQVDAFLWDNKKFEKELSFDLKLMLFFGIRPSIVASSMNYYCFSQARIVKV